MAIKLSSKNRDNIPTLTEAVVESDGKPSQPTLPAQAGGNPKNNVDGPSLPPKFERVLEKIIYKKLHPQLVATSQALAAEIMTELEKHLQAGNLQNKPDKKQS